jgi:hypothetical protein
MTSEADTLKLTEVVFVKSILAPALSIISTATAGSVVSTNAIN